MTREELNKKKQRAITNQVKKRKYKKFFFIFFNILLIVSLIIVLFLFLNKYFFTKKIFVNENRIISSKISDEFDGLKIIHFSDLHYGTTIFMNEVNLLVELINERNPDLVIFTGDLIDKNYQLKTNEQEKLINALSNINANIGKYTIFGEEDKVQFTTIMNQSDFFILNNDYDLIYNNSNLPILISGISSKINNQDDISQAFRYFSKETYNSDIFTIALIHEPDLMKEINNLYSVDLVLAGHSHNGSIRYPWGGSPYKINGAKDYFDKYYKINNSQLFISSGIGTNGNGIRFFCFPSFNFFRLSKNK